MLATLALFLLPTPAAAQQSDSPWTELFPGGEIGEWTVVGGDGKYEFVEEDGVPVLYGHSATRLNTFLVSPREYADFVLEIDVKIEAGGNSGVQFRSHINDKGRLFGYQAEIDPSARSWSAGIYDEGRRGWIADLKDNAAAREAFKVGEWNTYRIEASGGLLRTWVNDVPAADLYDEADFSGLIALQVHNGGKTHVRWRNARIRELAPLWKEAEQIASGVLCGATSIQRRGTPGTISVFGSQATPVLLETKSGLPVAAAARWGEGRVVAVAHNSYSIDGSVVGKGAVSWLMSRVNSVSDLDRAGLTLKWTGAGPTLEALERADVLVTGGLGPLEPERARELREWIARGGTLYAAVCPWGWEQVNAKRGWTLAKDLGENQILAPMGLVFADGYADAKDGRFPVTPDALAMAHATVALASLPLASGEPPSMVPVEHALRSLPRGAAPAFEALFATLVGEVRAENAPRPKRALKKSDPYGRLAVTAATLAWRDLPASEVRPAVGVESFPGVVADGAIGSTREIGISGTIPQGWMSTGLYLAPGEVLSVTITGTPPPGWRLRVGCHKDKVWHKDSWKRWPEVSSVWSIAESTEIATPWGGIVYLEADGGWADFKIRFNGTHPYPLWTNGMKAAQWRKQLATKSAPWAELEGSHLILSVPIEAARTLEDPTELMAFWDSVMEAHCKLSGEPMPLRRERFVTDAQISAGYMHAGYPIMTWLDVVDVPKDGSPPVMLDFETLSTAGNWGMFHELGHNRQQRDWTFGGTGEVTCNWFSLHAGDLLCGIEPWQNPWLNNQKKAGAKYLADGADYQVWRSKPGIALICYAQLQHGFGWEPYYETTAWYRELADGDRPKNDQAKSDLWVKRMSLATGHDLRPFHLKWGWPLGDALQKDTELAELPAWMPDFDELR